MNITDLIESLELVAECSPVNVSERPVVVAVAAGDKAGDVRHFYVEEVVAGYDRHLGAPCIVLIARTARHAT